MDRLDKFSLLAIACLVMSALFLLYTQPADPGNEQDEQRVATPIKDPALDNKIALAKNLLAGNNIEQAEALLAELIKTYPFESTPYFLNGDLRLYHQDPVGAMQQYRKAVDLNPDFLDKKSALFQGKKVKKTVEEARAIIEKGLSANSGDATLQAAKKEYYYMLRKIAGSCG